MMDKAEIHYKVAWRARSNYPGAHPSQQKGGGHQFRHHVPFLSAPDPRRFDVRASLKDPFETLYVRLYQQTSAIPVYVLADLSASMSYEGEFSKQATIADFIHALSFSSYKLGDRFGFVGLSDKQTAPIVVPASMNRAAGIELSTRVRGLSLEGQDADGLFLAPELLGSTRALVFLISDFHFDDADIAKLVSSLAHHDVIPVVLWDKQEHANLPKYGIARVADPETGDSRMLFMRPSLRDRIEQTFEHRRQQLFGLLSRLGRPPIMLEEGFNAEIITDYFYH
ncbi:MAG: DUF58 domain-containing protein [Gammaproteobacteria bacterium]